MVKRLSFARADDLVTHMTMQIITILNRSTSATGPAVTGIMSCKFKGVVVYVSVPTVKLKFVPIITWRRKKPFSGGIHNLVKAPLALTITVASDPPPGACEGGVQTIYKEQALDCHLQSH